MSTTINIPQGSVDTPLQKIVDKVINGNRITSEEGLYLLENGELSFLGVLANYIRQKKHGDTTYFNRNFHIEPTNLCIYACKFCSYSRLIKDRDDGWVNTEEEILDQVRAYNDKPITEVHIVGGVYPKLDLDFFLSVLPKIKEIRPDIHIKGFTAVELEYMFHKSKVTQEEGLKLLKEHGLDSLPGGGAEIFHDDIRTKICDDKVTAEGWINIHRTAHQLGMKSNATMLYGHYENNEHRIHHLDTLRTLQDETGGFNTFIPLKFRNKENEMSSLKEVSVIDDLKVYAVSRIYLDNFDHIKAYWPMIGKKTTQLSLSFGVNDVDGTIDDSTKIYSMAGAEDKNPVMTTEELVGLIKSTGRKPIERDTLYNIVQEFE